MVADAHTIVCMTKAQCDAVLRIAADAAGKTTLIDPAGDLPDPHGKALAAYRDCADRIRQGITRPSFLPEAAALAP